MNLTSLVVVAKNTQTSFLCDRPYLRQSFYNNIQNLQTIQAASYSGHFWYLKAKHPARDEVFRWMYKA